MTYVPQRGDYGCVLPKYPVDQLIRVLQFANGDGWAWSRYCHAFIVESVDPDGTVHAIEAWPGGARRDTYLADDPKILWSQIQLTDDQRTKIVDTAVSLLGTPYSYLDYLAIAAHHLHLPGAGLLENKVADTHHVMCSYLVDLCYRSATVELLPSELPGYVTPAELARVAVPV